MKPPLAALAIAALGPAALPSPADAARPMITDDARIVDDRACQLEAWTRRNPDSTEYWALPACNPFGNLEVTFGGGRTRGGGADRFTDQVDATYGNRLVSDSNARWFSIGLRILTPPFLR